MRTEAKGLLSLKGLNRKLLLLCLLTMGCFGEERKPPNAKPVIPVNGVVLVDGKPLANILIKFHAVVEDPTNATLSVAKTDAEGRFKAFTYRADDGVPPGDYTVTFMDQSKPEPFERNPDLFKGKYTDPKKSDFKLTVPAKGGPIDMGKIELTH